MIFLLDLGNESLNRCLFDTKAEKKYRTYTDKRKSEGEYLLLRKQYLAFENVKEEEIEGAILLRLSRQGQTESRMQSASS